MSAIVGERDKALRGTVPRNINPTLGKSMTVNVDPPAFHQNSAGIPTITSALFTVTLNGFVGQVMWSITSGGKLTGSTPNERTLLFSDMTADSVKVTATIVYDGQAYIDVKTFYKLTDGKDGKDGADADPADLSPQALAALLEGQITESSLYPELASRIDLVDGPASNPQTVQGKIKAETDARVTSINQEVTDRIAALVAASGAQTTYVQTYTYSKAETDSSLSIQATAITAAYKSYADTAKTLAIAAASADVRNYAYSKTDIESSEATQTSTLTANYKAYADGVGSTAATNATAYVQQYAYSKATSDSALTAMANTLRSEFASNSGVSVAYLNNYAYSKADTNSAISSATQTLSTTVGDHTATLQSQATSIGGLSAQWALKTDINGYVTGFGLASSIATGTPTSVFIVNAGAFSVVVPGAAPQPIFTVGTVAGVSKAVFRADVFADGSITASKLVIGGSPDNVLPDPSFNDLAWWGRPDGNISVQAGAWLNGRTLYFGSTNASVESDSTSTAFPMTPGATYKLEFQVQLSGDFQGNLSVATLFPGNQWHLMGAPTVGNWASSDQLPISFNSASPKGLQSFQAIFTSAAVSDNSVSRARIRVQVSAGFALVGSLAITRVSDTVLIKDGAITAQKITVDKLQAISSIVVARVGATGAGVDMDINGARTYDTNSIKRFQWGNLDA